MTQPRRPWIILLTGMPGSGKSTIAQHLVTALFTPSRPILAIHMDRFLPDWAVTPINEHYDRAVLLTTLRAATEYTRANLDIILDGVLVAIVGVTRDYDPNRTTVQAALSILAPYQVFHIGVRCNTDVLIQRCIDRAAQNGLSKSRQEVEQDLLPFRGVHTGQRYDFEVDTTTTAPEVVTAQIVERLRRGA